MSTDPSPRRDVVISALSVWELTLLDRLGRIFVPEGPVTFVDDVMLDLGLVTMDFTPRHAFEQETMPFFKDHRDPFDRMLIAQALAEGLPLISADDKFDRYGVERIW